MFKKLRKKIAHFIFAPKPLREIVLVLPYDTTTHKLLIIEEYIHHYDRKFWKLVTGGIDKKDIDNLQHAHEELAEEMAMRSDNLYHFHSFEKVFGMRGIHCFVAEDPIVMEHPPENPDTDVITQSKWINEQELWEMIDAKELIWNESAMAAAQVFRRYIKR